jgi:hypothetical protein
MTEEPKSENVDANQIQTGMCLAPHVNYVKTERTGLSPNANCEASELNTYIQF